MTEHSMELMVPTQLKERFVEELEKVHNGEDPHELINTVVCMQRRGIAQPMFNIDWSATYIRVFLSNKDHFFFNQMEAGQ